jgi:hypothetical protein
MNAEPPLVRAAPLSAQQIGIDSHLRNSEFLLLSAHEYPDEDGRRPRPARWDLIYIPRPGPASAVLPDFEGEVTAPT